MEWHIPLPAIKSIKLLDQKIIACTRCPRLVEWREEVAVVKRKSYENEKYWGKPVPGFGPENARIVIVGLAPGAHGANRTGSLPKKRSLICLEQSLLGDACSLDHYSYYYFSHSRAKPLSSSK